MADKKIHSTIYGPELERDEQRTATLLRATRDRVAAEQKRDATAHAELEEAGFLENSRALREAIASGDPNAVEDFERRHAELKAKYRPSPELLALKKEEDEAADQEAETRSRLLGPLHEAEAEWNEPIDGEESLADKARALNQLFPGQSLLKGQILREYAREMGLHVPDLPTANETDRQKECAGSCRAYLRMFVRTEEEWENLRTGPREWTLDGASGATLSAFRAWQKRPTKKNWRQLRDPLQIDLLAGHWEWLRDELWKIEPAFGSLDEERVRQAVEPMPHPLAQRKRSKVRKDSAVSMLVILAQSMGLYWTKDSIEKAEKRR